MGGSAHRPTTHGYYFMFILSRNFFCVREFTVITIPYQHHQYYYTISRYDCEPQPKYHVIIVGDNRTSLYPSWYHMVLYHTISDKQNNVESSPKSVRTCVIFYHHFCVIDMNNVMVVNET